MLNIKRNYIILLYLLYNMIFGSGRLLLRRHCNLFLIYCTTQCYKILLRSLNLCTLQGVTKISITKIKQNAIIDYMLIKKTLILEVHLKFFFYYLLIKTNNIEYTVEYPLTSRIGFKHKSYNKSVYS